MGTFFYHGEASSEQAQICVATSRVSWFALQTKPRHEKTVANGLRDKGISVFLPLTSKLSQWSDRKRLIEQPLFPNYVFVQTAGDLESRVPALRTQGVLGFVGGRGSGTPIPNEEIEGVRTIVEQKIPFAPHPFLEIGQRVQIRGGSLDGLQGFLLAKNGDQSLIVSLGLIQRSLSIRVSGYEVEPVFNQNGMSI